MAMPFQTVAFQMPERYAINPAGGHDHPDKLRVFRACHEDQHRRNAQDDDGCAEVAGSHQSLRRGGPGAAPL